MGIEPDKSRALAAKSQTHKLENIDTCIAFGDISILENQTVLTSSFDVILCSQILGHVPRVEMVRIIRCFESILRPGGKLILSIPIVGNAFSESNLNQEWQPGSDFTHLVNFGVETSDKSYRIRINEDEFTSFSSHPKPNILPVRCFWINALPEKSGQLPDYTNAIPDTVLRLVENSFALKKGMLYSVHLYQNEQPALGDMMFVLEKRESIL